MRLEGLWEKVDFATSCESLVAWDLKALYPQPKMTILGIFLAIVRYFLHLWPFYRPKNDTVFQDFRFQFT